MNKLIRAATFIGLGITVIGLLVAPGRIWPNILIAANYLTHLSLSALFLIAVLYVTKAGWGVAIRRIPEAMSVSLIWAFLLMLIVAFGAQNLYEWTHKDIVNLDHLLALKSGWLNPTFFTVRIFVYFLLWLSFGWLLIRNSRLQDIDGDISKTSSNIRISALFLAVFAVTLSLSSWDWLMSLEPHWYSTIFSAYIFAGMFLTGISATIIFAVIMKRKGLFNGKEEWRIDGINLYSSNVTKKHFHDLGKLLFAFSSFWAYLWFCQYMLIWYANIPEETIYFVKRRVEGWDAFFFMNLILNWIIPFDLYIAVMPVFSNFPVMTLWELGPMLFILSLFTWTTFTLFETAPSIPIKDPLLQESLGKED